MSHARTVFVTAALVAAALTGPVLPRAEAQGEPPRRTGIWGEIRDWLTRADAAELVARAGSIPSAAEAFPLYEAAASRDRSAAAQAACLWLGHFHHGAGDLTAALYWYEKGADLEADPGPRAEAIFWTTQCRELLGREGEGGLPRAERGGVHDLLRRIAEADGLVRRGRGADAIASYLALEDEARRAGCVGPLLYRLGLVAAGGRGNGLETGQLQTLARVAAASPERAQVSALVSVEPSSPPPAPAGEAGRGTYFAEVAAGDTARSAFDPAASEGAVAEAAPGASRPAFAVQLGAFRDPAGARREAERLRDLGLEARIEEEEVGNERFHAVRVGTMRSAEEAEEFARTRCTGLSWRVVRVAGERDRGTR